LAIFLNLINLVFLTKETPPLVTIEILEGEFLDFKKNEIAVPIIE
jgi:hypothetical protein